jgi:hypothetical protein
MSKVDLNLSVYAKNLTKTTKKNKPGQDRRDPGKTFTSPDRPSKEILEDEEENVDLFAAMFEEV